MNTLSQHNQLKSRSLSPSKGRLVLLLSLMLLTGAAMAQRDEAPGLLTPPTLAHVTIGGNVFGGGNLAAVAHHSSVIINQSGATIAGDVYGGGAKADVNTLNTTDTTGVTLTQGIITGDVFGGGLGDLESLGGDHSDIAALVNGPVTVKVNGGRARNVYGCNNLNGAPQSTVKVNIEGGTVDTVFGGGKLASTPIDVRPEVNINGGTVNHEVYGGGALADVGGTTVNIMGGTVSGDIYGGGLGRKDVEAYNDPETGDPIVVAVQGIPAAVNGVVQVNIGRLKTVTPEEYDGNATIGGSVYGCNNLNGSPKDNVFVDVYRTAHDALNKYPQDDDHNLLVSLEDLDVADPEADDYAKKFAIKAVYGGGNQAHYIPETAGKISTVHIWGCTENTIQTVYGGGNAADVGSASKTAHTSLRIDGGRFDRVFGGGNGYSESGNHDNAYEDALGNCTDTPSNTPCSDYNPGANIYGTATTEIYGGLYRQVFGGSNQYGNVNSMSLSLNMTCDTLLIYESFGGGNEAVINGDVTTTLGCSDFMIGTFYGGSNLADINGDVTLNVQGGHYENVFGGSKGRLESSTVSEKAANINGNVTLNLYGGTMINAFGGNDVLGRIRDTITVNVLHDADLCSSFRVDTIYGGGRDAAYAPDSIPVTKQKIVSPVVNLWHGTVGEENESHEVTVPGCVFGGGKGATAVVTANPKVNIGDIEHTGNNNQIKILGHVFGGGNAAAVDGIDSVLMVKANSEVVNLYGGGNAAYADSAVVIMNVNAKVDTIFGGGNMAGLGDPDNHTGGYALIEVSNGTVKGGIYGGSDRSGTIYGDIHVNVTGGTVGANNRRANIHGGGYGYETASTGDVTVNFGAENASHLNTPALYGDLYGGSGFGNVNASTSNSTTVNIINGEITGDVYGGGLGSTSPNYAAAVNGNVTVNIGKEIENTLYNHALFHTYGTEGADGGNVFGCNNANGAPQGTVTVNVNGNVAQNVFGGGNEAAYTYSGNYPAVNIFNGAVSGSVFGGGKGGTAIVTGRPTVVVGDNAHVNTATVGANVYGGGDLAKVAGSTSVTIQQNSGAGANTTVTGSVYGGGNQANVSGSTEVLMTRGTVSTDVYGGGALAHVNVNDDGEHTNGANTTVSLTGGTVQKKVFGGGMGDGDNAALVYGNTTVTVDGTVINGDGINTLGDVIGGVFGGCNFNGTVMGDATVEIDSIVGTAVNHVNVYGGGLGANTNVQGSVMVTIDAPNSTLYGDVYGGSAKGLVNYTYGSTSEPTTGNGVATTVTLTNGTVTGDIYGGGHGLDSQPANVGRGVVVNVNGGSVNAYGENDANGGNVFGCNNEAGRPLDTVRVNINSNVAKNVYGGGNLAIYTAKTGYIDYPKVFVNNGRVANVFGGGLGSSAVVTGNPVVTIGEATGTHCAVVSGNVYGGGDAAKVVGNTTVVYNDNDNGSSVAKLFGGGNAASVEKTEPTSTTTGMTSVTLTSGKVTGGVYGGCNSSGTVQGVVTVNVQGGQVGAIGDGNSADVYGGGYGSSTSTTSDVTVTLQSAGVVYGDLYGGSALGSVNEADSTTTVNLKNGNLHGRVFGGGKGQTGSLSYTATTNGNVEVNIEANNDNGYLKNIYGGANVNGIVLGDIAVNIKANVGNTGNDLDTIFGGGLGANTTTQGNVTVTVDKLNSGATAPIIHGDVYGGSALGQVNPDSFVPEKLTKVDLKNGTVNGTIYGGGMGNSTTAALVNGDIEVAVAAGTATSVGVYGGCNVNGTVKGDTKVGINGTVNAANNTTGVVFGGGLGQNTVVNGSVAVNVDTGAAIYGDVHGGSAKGLVNCTYNAGSYSNLNSDTTGVTLANGVIHGNLYGGGLGESGVSGASADVYGPVTVLAKGGEVNNVFGANNLKGSPQSTVVVNVESGVLVNNDVFGGGNQANYIGGSPVVNIKGGTVKQNVFGGGNLANVGKTNNSTTTHINVSGGTVGNSTTTPSTYGIYGGCNTSGTVNGDIEVNITGGTLGQSGTDAYTLKGIYGGGKGASTRTTDNVTVKIGEGSTTPTIYGDVYGGSALGWVGDNASDDLTKIDFKNGTLYGKLYGGGMGDTSDSARVISAVQVNIADGTIYNSIYGGCNYKGGVDGRITINVNGGTIGSSTNLNQNPSITADIFGGGYGEKTTANSDVEVNFGTLPDGIDSDHSVFPKLYGDIYGGSALGSVNSDATNDTTYVNIFNGTLYTFKRTEGQTPTGQDYYKYFGGNIYGGGLGDEDDSGKGKVYGPIIVNVGDSIHQQGVHGADTALYFGCASIEGNVYGCNNTNGSPQENVTVNIFGTHHTTGDTGDEASNTGPNATFAIDNVFGGGNEADYDPKDSEGHSVMKEASVRIFGCDNTIERSFGGGNAAAAPNVLTDIQGGRFSEVYGGGNGERGSGYAADIKGSVTLQIHGGDVGMFFVGSNQNGTITGSSTVTVDQDGPCNNVDIDEFFCGGNYADFIGNIDATISCSNDLQVRNLYGGCNLANVVDDPETTDVHEGNIHLKVYGGVFENVYGGSKGLIVEDDPATTETDESENSISADIEGNIVLDIFGGTIDTVFGGSNVNGNVFGKITVNIFDLEHDPCGLTVHNVYGGGRDASYTPTTPGNYPEVNIINGWVSKKTPTSGGNVFGGGYGVKATVSSNPKVRIGYDDSMAGLLPSSLPSGYSQLSSLLPYEAKVDSLVFGGGDMAAVAGNTHVTIQKDKSQAHSLFGGGNNASVGNATVEVLGGSVTAGVYGGCNASGSVGGNIDKHSYSGGVLQTTSVAYDGNIEVNLTGGEVGVDGTTTDVVFGGGYGHSTSTTGNIDVVLDGSTVYGDLYGGSALGSVNAGTGNTSTVTLMSATLHGSVFGGGMGSGMGEGTKATTLGNATININVPNTDGILTGIYGGANVNGDVAGNIDVNVKANVGATGDGNSRDIFGGGLGAATTTGGDVTVTIGKDNTTPIIYGDVYGGSALGAVGNSDGQDTTKVDFKNGTLNGRIYGGGMGQTGSTNIEAMVNGDVVVDVTDGSITDGVYGGCNERGTVTGDITVNANGGTIGTSHTARANVHGGGLGNATATTGDVEVNINGATVYGDIYGGSGFGNVNATGDTTTVNILDGTIYGDIYGGGLGDRAVSGDPTHHDYAALVNGKVFVNIGSDENHGNATISTYTVGDNPFGGNVFGCNNANGSPQDSVFVNIYHTAHTTTPINNTYPSEPTGGWTVAALATNSANQKYAIQAVYGGGNEAAYTPALSGTDPRSATVHVYGCQNNTIEEVYGGGNAADVGLATKKANTFVIIDGGRINRVFGGGKGDNTVSPSISANIHGTATSTINAGLIDTIFGGGNMSGDIDSISLVLAHVGTCTEVFNQVYGGANEAAIAGNLNTTINCGVDKVGDIYGGSNLAQVDGNVTLNIRGGHFNNVFGGSKGAPGDGNGADITGNVELNLNGGEMVNAFGGSNVQGNIGGLITVNVLDTVTGCGLVVDTIYGGGQDAAYSPTNPSIVSPIVNLLKGTVGESSPAVAGCVFGGGKGSGAEVTANPKVVIGDMATGHENYQVEVLGNVFGGGNAAPVNGIDTILMQKSGTYGSQVVNLFGGGNKATAGSTVVVMTGGTVDTIFGGGNLAGLAGTARINMNEGTANKGIYGGCNVSGTVDGNVTVNINGGTVGADGATANVHGGGYGQNTKTGANVEVTIAKTGAVAPVIWGDVYGGSALGSVNSGGETPSVNTLHHTYVTLTDGTVNGDIYGGGLGDDVNNIEAKLWSPVLVTVNGGSVTGSVYGCNNLYGAPQSTVQVDINNSVSGSVFGGGNLAQYSGSPVVNINNGTVGGNVFGGGKGVLVSGANRGQKGKVTGNPQVTVGDSDGSHTVHVTNDVYGGGDAANVDGTPVVVVNDCNTTIGYLYGGGNAADVTGTNVTVNAVGSITEAYGGGHGDKTVIVEPLKYADVNGNVVFNVYGGTISKVFAGSNSKGSITGTSTLTVNKTGTCPMKIAEVYGGGNEAAGNAGTINIGCTGTLATLGTNEHYGIDHEGIQYVYGGANNADINNNIHVEIHSGIVENVFGGNNIDGTVNGTIQVDIDSTGTCGWYVGNVYGGGNQATYGTGNNYPVVNILSGLVSGDVFGGGLGVANNDTKGVVTGNPQVTANGAYARVNGSVYGGGSLAPTIGNPQVTLTNGSLTKVFGGGKAANVTGAPTVTITGGTVSTGVYGGCDSQGNVSGNITVNVNGGTIGSQANLNNLITADVYGGGYGPHTTTSKDVTVYFGVAPATSPGTPSDSPKIFGNVYGGSALGSVNTNSSDHTTVHILNGTLKSKITQDSNGFDVYNGGNVFGGGLGDSSYDTCGRVNGVVEVNIGAPARDGRTLDPEEDQNRGNASIEGNVYGCNNTNGSPKDSVTVNVYRTYRSETDEIYVPGNDTTYAIPNVFGGGNQANYVPLNTADHKKLKVMIHGCYNSVRRVFGGSNAAASGSSSVPTIVSTNIDGGRFHQVFGGGNGEVSAANIFGDLDLQIHGGIVGQFYGASNQTGSISGDLNLLVDNSSNCESVEITEFFCGGNYADIHGNLETTITCSQGLNVTSIYGGCNQANIDGDVVLNLCGGTYTNVFGGSKGRAAKTNGPSDPGKPANITGNVTLNLYGGTITNVFGGSNLNGNIDGVITVNVIDAESTTCPLDVTNIYGGSNETNYTPGNASAISPVVNVIHAKNGIHGNVYGGSKGVVGATTPTKVVANPRVNIGYEHTTMTIPSGNGIPTLPATANWRSTIQGSVFGGGDAAKVEGNTEIFLNKGAKVMQNVYGGGNMGEVDGDTKVIINGKRQ